MVKRKRWHQLEIVWSCGKKLSQENLIEQVSTAKTTVQLRTLDLTKRSRV
jgi:hypothetical protein